jgi:hypothetical protein
MLASSVELTPIAPLSIVSGVNRRFIVASGAWLRPIVCLTLPVIALPIVA